MKSYERMKYYTDTLIVSIKYFRILCGHSVFFKHGKLLADNLKAFHHKKEHTKHTEICILIRGVSHAKWLGGTEEEVNHQLAIDLLLFLRRKTTFVSKDNLDLGHLVRLGQAKSSDNICLGEHLLAIDRHDI